jgi:hypothetical protein
MKQSSDSRYSRKPMKTVFSTQEYDSSNSKNRGLASAQANKGNGEYKTTPS